jgi:uncharacterized protein YndB with AHSA1/START domain
MLVAKTEMLIRRPVDDVFKAFVDPAITSRFWFTSGSGRLEAGNAVRWDWAMYDFSTNAAVKEIEPNRRILVEWSGAQLPPTTIEWTFGARPHGTTYVTITNSGFTGDPEQAAKQAIAATEGFAFVLAGAKAWLEHGLQMNLVADKYPDGLPRQ